MNTADIAELERPSALPTLALAERLEELSSVVVGLPNEVYRATVDGVPSGSIGQHVRHSLEHVSALLAAGAAGILSYDHRHRGTAIETEPGVALEHILRMQTALQRWPAKSLDEPVRVKAMLDANGDSVIGWSTLARELAFVLSHTIHHQAIIGLLLALHGYRVPDRFGHSPSTPRRN